MSFGTVFWPTKPEYIDEVLEAFIEKRCPFVCVLTLYILGLTTYLQ